MKTGEFLIISTGEYSDYSIRGLFRVTKRFSLKGVLRRYLEEHPKEREDYEADFDNFVAWLSAEGYIVDVDHRELWLGGYSCWQDSLLGEVVDE